MTGVPIPGTPAPDFNVTVLTSDYTFEQRKLSDYKGKYLLIVFYPFDFTFACPTEIVHFAQAAEKLKKMNCNLLIGSCDSQFSHYAWTLQSTKEGGIGHLDVDLFADKNGIMAQQYGIYVQPAGCALRGTFVIDAKQVVRSVQINDFQVGRSVDECLRLIKAFQYADKTGDAVPCDWKGEQDGSIKQDLKESKKYFETHG